MEETTAYRSRYAHGVIIHYSAKYVNKKLDIKNEVVYNNKKVDTPIDGCSHKSRLMNNRLSLVAEGGYFLLLPF